MIGKGDPIVSLAGLTKWSMPFDRVAGTRVPTVADDPGIIHAVRPVRRETSLREPIFLEDIDYRAALCGAKVKVIMPSTFKPDEVGGCPACAAVRPGNMIKYPKGNSAFPNYGDRWSPRARRRKHQGRRP
ncbi:hypothetical protein ASF72_18335 [Arthrobacter sp. Leaf141]|nr:hypothetical protein ASF72_18335 [Arthrobacter sp. Leaf141]